MSAVDDAKTIIQLMAGKNLNNAIMLNVANQVIASQGNLFQNPWDEIANPTEFAAWPTTEEKATFFILVGRRAYQKLLFQEGHRQGTLDGLSAVATAAEAARDQI